MGTHPIFESDFDCLTESPKIKYVPESVRFIRLDLVAPGSHSSNRVRNGGGQTGLGHRRRQVTVACGHRRAEASSKRSLGASKKVSSHCSSLWHDNGGINCRRTWVDEFYAD